MDTKQCPHCGATIPVEDRFCSACGQPVETVASTTPATNLESPPALGDVPGSAPIPPAGPGSFGMPATGAMNDATTPPVYSTPPVAPAPPLYPSPLGAAAGSAQNQQIMAIASLVLGVLSLCGFLFWYCSAPLGIVGLVLGYGSMKGPQRTLAIVGMALCGVGLALAVATVACGFGSGIISQLSGG